MKKILTIAAAAVLILNSMQSPALAADATKPNVIQIASGNPDFSTLVTAIKAAGLDSEWSTAGPVTVFAPTNEAFAKLPKDKLDELLKPENKEKLASVLKYHVVPGKILAADVKPGNVKTLLGQEIEVTSKTAGTYYGSAKVIKPDIVASNGVIHVIDTVVLPK